jgi:hypothetical protein
VFDVKATIKAGPHLARSDLLQRVTRAIWAVTDHPLKTQGDVPWCAAWFARQGFQVVDESKWSSALIKVAGGQTAAGLDWSTRVHMERKESKAASREQHPRAT